MSQIDLDERDRAEAAGFSNGGFAPESQYLPPAVIGQTTVTADTGIITAQRVAVPRDDGVIMRKIKAAAAMAGDDFYYRWPVKNKDGTTDMVEGPSIKCATAVARIYGNCYVGCRAIDEGTHYQILGRFADLETGFQIERPFRQRKNQRTMKTDADRQADIVFQIGVSKATRNVISNALELYTTYAVDLAKQNLIERVGRKLDEYRDKVLYRLQDLKVDLPRVERVMGKTAKEWLAPDIARLIAEIQSAQDGMASPAELWPVPQEPSAEAKPAEGESKLDQFAGAADGAAAQPTAPTQASAASVATTAAQPAAPEAPAAQPTRAASNGPAMLPKIGEAPDLAAFYDRPAGHKACADAMIKLLTATTTDDQLDELLIVPARIDRMEALRAKAPKELERVEQAINAHRETLRAS